MVPSANGRARYSTPVAASSTSVVRLFAERVLIDGEHFVVGQEAEREGVELGHVAADQQRRATSRHQRVMCVYCSSGVSREFRRWPQPTLPTTSMSGSLKWPGPAKSDQRSWEKPMPRTEGQVSVMSSVVRQQLARRSVVGGVLENGAVRKTVDNVAAAGF